MNTNGIREHALAKGDQGILNRRQFIARATAASAALGWGSFAKASAASAAAAKWPPPIGVFSKVYQEVKLSFDETAAVTAEAGLDGIDCPVRPGGQILPERAA